MADINRAGSSMDLLDENLGESPVAVRSKRKLLEDKQRNKSPFLIGSIEEVNKRISTLENNLQNYQELVCESRASSLVDDERQIVPISARRRDQFQQREKEMREVRKFAGIYTVKSTFFPNLSYRARNITKISIKPKEQKSVASSKADANRPKLVELHQYPGFDSEELAVLPNSVQATDIFNRVVEASVHLNRKPRYRPEFEDLFFSQVSEAIFLDTFWYVFLEKFQRSQPSQQKLFDRVAHNYVKLIMTASDSIIKDTFFKDYPKLMSQTVYSAFCFCFPNSYRQFGEKFKDELLNLVYGWMAGIRPSPRSWSTWDMSSLEPPNLKHQEEMISRKNNRKARSLIDLDYLDSLTGSSGSQTVTSRSRSLSQSRSSASAVHAGRPERHAWFNMIPVTHKSVTNSTFPRRSQSPELGKRSRTSSNADAAVHDKTTVRKSEDHGRHLLQNSASLTTVQEQTTENNTQEPTHKSALTATSQTKSSDTYFKSSRESHPVGKSCDYVRHVFNTEGKSPLVEYFLRTNGLGHDAGQLVWVQRVELDNLSSLDAPTYKDIIADTSKNIEKIKTSFQERHKQSLRGSQLFMKEQRAVLKEHMRKQASLLVNEKEVKRLSDLIIMEQRRSKDSVSAGADAALAAALMAQD